MEKKKTILTVLTALFFITLVYRIMNPFQQQTVSRLTYQPGQSASVNPDADRSDGRLPDPDTSVVLELLMNPQRQSARVFRNIFEKKSAAADRTPPRTAAPTLPEPVGADSDTRANQFAYGLQQEISRFTVFGAVESDAGRFVFLERSKDIFIVRQGDVIDGKYRIRDISDQAMTIQSEADGQSASIDISDIFSRGD
jgi:hypothetical protein